MKWLSSLVVVMSCGAPVAGLVAARSDGGGFVERFCATDVDCPDGMLCEACGEGRGCVPGCRENADCSSFQLCNHAVQCLTCPCPSGLCDLDPCRDQDNDGYAAAASGTCALPIGDCNDANPKVNPSGRERCADGEDNDCDGRTDTADSDECQNSCTAGLCAAASWCRFNEYCDRGCCTACVTPTAPSCQPGECLLEQGRDLNGCLIGMTCVTCACGGQLEPVCGKNFSTYDSTCEAALLDAGTLHQGACLRGEGVTCADNNDCFGQQVCRAFGSTKRCAKLGTCTVDADCTSLGAVSCGDGGLATLRCQHESCAAFCD